MSEPPSGAAGTTWPLVTSRPSQLCLTGMQACCAHMNWHCMQPAPALSATLPQPSLSHASQTSRQDPPCPLTITIPWH